jgi:hypothetical protein
VFQAAEIASFSLLSLALISLAPISLDPSEPLGHMDLSFLLHMGQMVHARGKWTRYIIKACKFAYLVVFYPYDLGKT